MSHRKFHSYFVKTIKFIRLAVSTKSVVHTSTLFGIDMVISENHKKIVIAPFCFIIEAPPPRHGKR